MLSSLEEGLQGHFALEAKYLAPFLGEFLMRAIVIEHREISGQIDEARSMASDAKLEELSGEELLPREAHVQQVVGTLCQLVEEHTTKEEGFLEMLQRAIEEEGRATSQH